MRDVKNLDVEKLNQIYDKADRCDSDIFAEQRSNILIANGFHYSKQRSEALDRIRNSKGISDDQKIRLTKNHTYKIVNTYVNNIWKYAPDTSITPRNKNEMSDQKAAELHQSVLSYIKEINDCEQKNLEYLEDFVTIGECGTKITVDPMAGKLLGEVIEKDEFGNPIMDEDGAPKIKKIYEGKFNEEIITGFDLLRSPASYSFDESPYLIHRYLGEKSVIAERYRGDEEKIKMIEDSSKGTYKTFDANTGKYNEVENQCLIKEFYFRPNETLAEGYFYITVEEGILESGPLPGGIFPIEMMGFQRVQKSARGRSIIKQLRPYQAEINRASSKVAETQIVLGDDKLLMQKGSTMSHAAQLPGLKAVHYTGATPIVLAGRAGDQYVSYINGQISEMYGIANVPEDSAEKQDNGADPYQMLFRSIKQRKAFGLYASKFQRFLIKKDRLLLRLAKFYLPDEALIPMIGRPEMVNIAEFKNAQDLNYLIVVEASNDDVESKLGRQLVLNHAIQYIGPNMQPDQIGALLKAMPFGNDEQAFALLTVDHDNAKNEILALDRGEYPATDAEENHEFAIKMLSHRKKMADFRFIADPIKQNYELKLQEHRQLLQVQIQAKKLNESDFIPSGGPLIGVDLYVPQPNSPGKTQRARLPMEAVIHLIDTLANQGMTQDQINNLPDNQQAMLGLESQASLDPQAAIAAQQTDFMSQGQVSP